MGDPSPELSSLQETLEAVYCPPLDTTIVALLIADHLSENKPDEHSLKILRDQLSVLAASAAVDQDDLAKRLHDLHMSAATDDSASRDADSVFSQTGLNASSSSASSSSPPGEIVKSPQSDSALDFLQASFPYMPSDRLRIRLDEADFDMERIVEDLLSEEYVKELEERGFHDDSPREELERWTVVSNRSTLPSGPTKSSTNRKRKRKGKTIVLNDVRQKHHIHLEPQFRSADPWSQVASISSYLETLLDRPSSFFQPFFHNPQYPTPSTAVRAALKSLEKERQGGSHTGNKEIEPIQHQLLMEFIGASPDFGLEKLDHEAVSQICTDAELSLAAAGGSPDIAFDLVKLLHELELDGESAQEMCVYHSPASPLLTPSTSQSSILDKAVNSTVSVPVSPVSQTSRVILPTPPSVIPRQRPPPAPSQNAWQTVTPTRRKPPDVHPLAAYIPAYDPSNVPHRKPRSNTNKPGPLDTNSRPARGKSTLGSYKARIEACNAKRDEALRAASRHWNSGGARNRGGEIALYYALEAQRLRAETQQLQLDAMRQFVDGKRRAGTDTDTIDVHHCTTSEALTIVREVLDEGWVCPARPLCIITGRGNHSTGGVGVLGPAVKKALENDGWTVGQRDGGLTVRQRRQ